ncbi:MAG: YitT family protein [Tissierellia bacterium]|nr:YitT family protein [Tissierellia bacterium]
MRNFWSYVKIHIGLLTVALGFHIFMVPSSLAAGGISGLALVVNSVFPFIKVGVFMLIMNIILFILGFLLIGKEFGGLTVYCSLFLSGAIALLEVVYPLSQPLVDDLLLNLVMGTLIQGIGMALVFYENASTGGTDVLAKILNKFFGTSIGKSLLMIDSLITLGAMKVFGLRIGLYSFLGVIMAGFLIDKIIAGFDERIQVMILSSEDRIIRDYILDDLGRGSTYLRAMGAYSQENRDMLTAVISKREYLRLIKFIKETDPKAFVTVGFVHEVYGEGFSFKKEEYKELS